MPSHSALVLRSGARSGPCLGGVEGLRAKLQHFSTWGEMYTGQEKAPQTSVHSQNIAFPKEPTEQEREGVGAGKDPPQPLGFSTTEASKYRVPQIPHRDQPHSHFYLKQNKTESPRRRRVSGNQAPTKGEAPAASERSRRRRHAGSVSFGTLLLAHLFHFHPTVLEPDFDLSLGEVQNPGHLVAPVPGEVHVEEEFLLQL